MSNIIVFIVLVSQLSCYAQDLAHASQTTGKEEHQILGSERRRRKEGRKKNKGRRKRKKKYVGLQFERLPFISLEARSLPNRQWRLDTRT